MQHPEFRWQVFSLSLASLAYQMSMAQPRNEVTVLQEAAQSSPAGDRSREGAYLRLRRRVLLV